MDQKKEDILNRIDKGTNLIVAFIEEHKGKEYGANLPGGINRMAKHICIRQYFQQTFDYLSSIPKANSWAEMPIDHLTEFLRKVDIVIFFINRQEENFVDFYNDEVLGSSSPGNNIGLVLSNGEAISFPFTDIASVTFLNKKGYSHCHTLSRTEGVLRYVIL